ncbi:MAG: type III-B CRISPR module RAMP protein Cmr6 [Candidatus Eisenbacteria bacterium]|nr:type III-B CRISPR module RAMP protein Cmr6 [Candidatus Eisenbacteria bacterium]
MARPSSADAPAFQPLPQGIRGVLDRQMRPKNGDNLGLWLDKYLPLDQESYTLKGPQRDRILSDIFVARDLGKPAPWRSDAARDALARQHESCKLLYGDECHRTFKLELKGRLILDYARVSTIESSLSFHATLGVPRIPGSAFKGLLRAALRHRLPSIELADLLGAPDLEDPSTAQQHARGRLVLHDALPEAGAFQLDLDVLTPHYREYYEGDGKVPPADWLSPIPHGFLTVVNTTFILQIGLLPPYPGSPPKSPAAIFDDLNKPLANALWQEGLGAKRSAGYGRFKLTQP